jgi:hypothetical protein
MESHLPNLKYIRRIFESSHWAGNLDRLIDLGIMLTKSEYAELLQKASTYIQPSQTRIDYSKQTIHVVNTFDESLSNLCDYYDIPANSYALSQAVRSLYVYVNASYDLQRGVVMYLVQVIQIDLNLNKTSRDIIKSLSTRGLGEGISITHVNEMIEFIAEDIKDFSTNEAIDISLDLIKSSLREKGYLDFA